MTDEFLKGLKSITTLDVIHEDFGYYGHGFHGSLLFHSDAQELLKRYPEVTQNQFRRACMVVLKQYMREERERWYAEEVYGK